MKKLILILTIALFSVLTYGQGNKPNSYFEKIRFGLGYNLSLESLTDEAYSLGISKHGLTWFDMYGTMSFLRYCNMSLGFSISHFKDEMPFSQSVSATSGFFSAFSYDEDSKLLSGGMYISGGVRVPITSGLNVIGNVGYKRFSSSRYIPDCSNCDSENAVKDRSVYLQPGVAWLLGSEDRDHVRGQFHLLYSHYINSIFNNSITVGFIVFF